MKDIRTELLEIMEQYKCNELVALLILLNSDKV